MKLIPWWAFNRGQKMGTCSDVGLERVHLLPWKDIFHQKLKCSFLRATAVYGLPALVEQETKTWTGIRLIYLPHNIECPISVASRFIKYTSPETLFLQTHKNVSSISSPSVLLPLRPFGGNMWPVEPTPSIWGQHVSVSSMDTNYTNKAGKWCHKHWMKDYGSLTAGHHCS